MLKKMRAFTLLELIVVIVILGLLAALAIPTFTSVINRSQDEVALNELKALSREAQAINAFTEDDEWNPQSPIDAIGDLKAYQPGINAAISFEPVGGFTGTIPVPSDTSPVTYSIMNDVDVLVMSKYSQSGQLCFVASLPVGTITGGCKAQTASDDEIDLGDVFDDGSIPLPIPDLPVVTPTPTPTDPPTTPTNPQPSTPTEPTYSDDGVVKTINITNIKYATATVNYSVVDKAIQYKVSYQPTNGGAATSVTTSNVNIYLTGLTPGTEYTISVQAVRPDNPAAGTKTFTTLTQTAESWTSWKTDIAQLPVAMNRVKAVTIDRTIYALGEGGNKMYAMNVDDNVWVEKASSGTAITAAANAFVYNNKIFVVGDSNKVRIYDPATNTWTTGATNSKGYNHYSGGIGVQGSKVYLIGGSISSASERIYVDVYDMATNKWATTSTSLSYAFNYSTVFTIDSTMYVVDGVKGSGAKGDSDPGLVMKLTSTFTYQPDSYRSTLTAVSPVVYQGKAYLIGGSTTTPTAGVRSYDPVTNTFTNRSEWALPEGISSAGAVVIDNKLIVIGGAKASGATNQVIYLD